ncbi:alpha-hydroxy-acid oxidizing protein [Denitromonas sp. IR12]|uniref:Alpha-hydroxy-acid oxidizing protein n=1 Tax=Denitromonas iodatirespirans TaxID=2795389 RepID=A0A944HBN8_DENI1|nr:alpha-hydroxy-acid oxidizing protein [Denitromonas iodatirespirans]
MTDVDQRRVHLIDEDQAQVALVQAILATVGALGVAHVLKLLREELEVTMALTGCATLADIDRSRLA